MKQDVDSENQLKLMMEEKISNGDWNVIIDQDLKIEHNYSAQIIQKYLDRKQRDYKL